MRADERDAIIARAMDTPPEAVPYLAELCADFDELGSSVDDAMALLDGAGAPPGAAIDLGCGKGVFAIALAKRGWRVRAVDLHPPFLDEVRRRAADAGVGDRVEVVEGELEAEAARTAAGSLDLALLMSIGRPWGTLAETVGALRRLVRPGGWILIDDAYLEGDRPAGPEYDGYASLEATERDLVAHGDAIVGRRIVSHEEGRIRHERELGWLRARGAAIVARDPAAAPVIERFLAQQAGAYDDLVGPVRGAMWLLRRGG
ncbi:MAG: class I SAM-dependent methyltransferase [Phycisphaerales bacterium]